MTTRWIYNGRTENGIAAHLAEEINIHPLLASILVDRGIKTSQNAHHFFNPSLNDLFDPFLLKDMEKAVMRIQQAIQGQERILVYGDYDVDGTTSVALVYGFLRHFYANIEYYIPDRYKEGYGISKEGIEYAARAGVSLIITLDCGIKAVEMTKLARHYNIEMVICDHHLPGENLPEAYAIIDPKQSECNYPYKELSGCGLGFKLIQAFCNVNHYDPDLLYDYLDLVVVSIAADIVPIDGENRILAYHGLLKLNRSPRPGLEALIEGSGIRDDINITSIVFGIGPRINASGRMDHAKIAVELLLTDDKQEAKKLAGMLDTKNNIRRNYDTNITQEAIEMIEANDSLRNSKSTVLFKRDWHKGVIGIVASRCLDKYYRPTIILTESNGKATGSARSVHGFDLYEAISECSDLLDQYGGHMYAAGLTIDISKIEAFKNRFEEVVSRKITNEQLIPQITIDAKADLHEYNDTFYQTLCRMAPFGPGNNQPVFMSEGLRINGRPRILKEQHLKFSVQQGGTDLMFDVIAFGQAQYADLVGSGMEFSMAYYLEENSFNGKTSLQLRAKDVKFD
jgi:single-stranded-DNA-specific exonuclease